MRHTSVQLLLLCLVSSALGVRVGDEYDYLTRIPNVNSLLSEDAYINEAQDLQNEHNLQNFMAARNSLDIAMTQQMAQRAAVQMQAEAAATAAAEAQVAAKAAAASVCEEHPRGFGIKLSMTQDGEFTAEFGKIKAVHRDGTVAVPPSPETPGANDPETGDIYLPETIDALSPVGGHSISPIFVATDTDAQMTSRKVIVEWGNAWDLADYFALANLSHQLDVRVKRLANGVKGSVFGSSLLETEWSEGGDDKGEEKKGDDKDGAKKPEKQEDAKEAQKRIQEHLPKFHYIFAAGTNGVKKCMTDTGEADYKNDVLTVSPSQDDKGYNALKNVMLPLQKVQWFNGLRFALVRDAVGDTEAQLGAKLAVTGQLKDDGLKTILESYKQLMADLTVMTGEQTEYAGEVKLELEGIRKEEPFRYITSGSDAYCGLLINKNWNADTGLFNSANVIGQLFGGSRCGKFNSHEMQPARYLTQLLQPDAALELTFEGLSGDTPLNIFRDKKEAYKLMEDATEVGDNAKKRVWSAGVMEATLNTLVVNPKRKKMWFYEVTKPVKVSQPAFVARLLASFWTTLGMEEAKCGSWVNRFKTPDLVGQSVLDPPNEALQLTHESKQLTDLMGRAFKEALMFFQKEVFDNDAKVCALLVKYTVVEILSDASYVLTKWRELRKSDKNPNSRKNKLANLVKASLEETGVMHAQWLWRSLWDFYIAGDIMNRDFCGTKAADESKNGKGGDGKGDAKGDAKKEG
eukprot:TRINITY_DN35170_c0_g1_i1.p1 TRINITY_DN35170_c0_g1~~TRINITY_DN35170_c0_g1_i1.p1  ORF type:complete len:773 (-),score=203.65 TRINITY_DN35170_c0_g1_i1:187-2421(-)